MIELRANGNAGEAVAAAVGLPDRYPEQHAVATLWLAGFLARLDRPDDALRTLDSACARE